MKYQQIYIIRHGETELNRQRIIQGQGIDAPLNDLGFYQAKAFFDYYDHLNFQVVLTSTLKRTHQTAAPFINKGIPWEQWAEINEIDWGIHEGKPSEPWMIDAYKTMLDEWQRGNFEAKLEKAESAAELSHRLGVFIDHLKTRTEERILVCCHGRAMRCLMCLLKGQHLREMENYTHSNTGLYKVILRSGKFTLELENDTRHLEKARKKL